MTSFQEIFQPARPSTIDAFNALTPDLTARLVETVDQRDERMARDPLARMLSDFGLRPDK